MKIFIKIIKFIKRKLLAFLETVKYYILYIPAIIKYGRRDIYLISERGTDARDNGFWFYKYLREKHSNLEVYYVIDKKSADYSKVAAYGNIVHHKSLKHYLLFIAARYKISTHIMGFAPNMPFYTAFNLKRRIKGKLIFLQHGIIKDNLIGLYQENTRLDLFICGAVPEYNYVKDNFHYQKDEVVFTGLARYDELNEFNVKKQILVMPTWRVFLKNLSEPALMETEYFQRWNSFLNNSSLIELLKKYNIQLVFYPHYEMQPYIKLFRVNSPFVKIANFNDYDVQTLLKKSIMLITDYSSVFFDFAYMQKNCIYYQFDYQQFMNNHYQKGYFDYETMGFGPVIKSEGLLIEYILQKIKDDFEVNSTYKSRIEQFFSLRDGKNCERIFKEIEKLKCK